MSRLQGPELLIPGALFMGTRQWNPQLDNLVCVSNPDFSGEGFKKSHFSGFFNVSSSIAPLANGEDNFLNLNV